MIAAMKSSFLDQFNSDLDILTGHDAQHLLDGRGIVIAAGGASVFTNAFVLVHILRRHLHCKLPIEIWHFGVSELSPRMQSLLRDLDVRTVDATDLIVEKSVPIVDGWQLKAFAVLWSHFAEVLLLDADQIPAIDPASAFEWEEYKKVGAIFWPDILDIRQDNPIWQLMGLPPQQTKSLESGQAVIDKRRHWRAMCATYLLNAAADTVYQLIYGDKDTFLIGWLMAQSPFSLVPHQPFVDEYGLMQRDFEGTIFLQHRTNAKLVYAGEQLWPQQALHREATEAALVELRSKWNGRIFVPPGRSMAARRLEAQIVETGQLSFEVGSGEKFSLEFLHDGEIGTGRGMDRQNWAVIDDGVSGNLQLTIYAQKVPTYWLAESSSGLWQGERIRLPSAPVIGFAQVAHAPAAPRRTLIDEFLAAANFPDYMVNPEAGFVEALKLLARIDPDVVLRLRYLAGQNEQGSKTAQQLSELADAVCETQIKRREPIFKKASILSAGYTR